MNSHAPEPTVIELDHVGLAYEYREVLTDVCLSIRRGDFVAITGPNGGGKTSLLHIILGLLKPTAGTVRVSFPAGTVGFLPQKNAVDAHFPISVGEVIASGLLGVSNLSREAREEAVARTLGQVELTELADRPIGRLSGGQVQRALLGRAIVSGPELLVMDEPLSYLDKHFEAEIYKLISGIAPTCTILLVSHEMSAIDAMANRHLIVDRHVTECRHTHHYAPADCY